MASSYYNPPTDTSDVGGIVCKYHHAELMSEVMLHYLIAQVGLKP
jgi:hypothetical protein